jgi:alpha-ketoglutarate-dependent taurine dioxygenase
MKRELDFIPYSAYMKDDKAFFQTLLNLRAYGLVVIRGVPEEEIAVENIANRIGPLRNTFYGLTWDVKSVPDAKNVAYTSQFLGLHEDLLYMADPPGFQLLHCLKNSTEGGESLFSDGFHAAGKLPLEDTDALSKTAMSFYYDNNGEYYYHEHPVLEYDQWNTIQVINYSPPFQAPLNVDQGTSGPSFEAFLQALRRFAAVVEDKSSQLEFKLQEGDCVIFNNRRVLHGRNAFNASKGGERWFKGTYVDTDAFMSRWRTFHAKWGNKIAEIDGSGKWSPNDDTLSLEKSDFETRDGVVIVKGSGQ